MQLQKSVSRRVKNFWERYQAFVLGRMESRPEDQGNKLADWQDKLFAKIVLYALPISMVALIPSVIMELFMSHQNYVTFDLSAIIVFTIIILNPRVSLVRRRIILVSVVMFFACIQILVLGYYVVGCIYLFGISIFVSFQFPPKYAYMSVALNFIIGLLPAHMLYMEAHWIPLVQGFTYERIIICAFNLLFLTLVVVVIIHQTLLNFERTMLKETMFYKALQKELASVDELNARLKEQNDKLREIAFMQSHVIRSPLTKIISLSDLIVREYEDLNDQPLFVYLDQSVQELDDVVCQIIKHSEEVMSENKTRWRNK